MSTHTTNIRNIKSLLLQFFSAKMDPKLRSPPPRLPISAPLFLLLVVVIPITTDPFSYSASCEATWSCGDLQNITYPFRLLSESDAGLTSYCGYGGFDLTCRNSTPILRFGNNNYTVTSIDLNAHTITVADADIDVVPNTFDYCPRLRHNFTLDPKSALGYAPSDDNLTFFYNCTDGGGHLEEYSIPCLLSAAVNPSYVLTSEAMEEYSDNIPRSCGLVVVAPVLNETLLYYQRHELGLLYGGTLRSGFQLSWPMVSSGDCGTCEESGGRCGLNKTINSSLAFACFCSDGIKAVPDCGAGSAEKKRKRTMLVLGIVIALATSSLLCLLLFFYIRGSTKSHKFPQKRKTYKNNWQSAESVLHGSLVPKRYKYAEVKRMTESFRYKLGQGGFGSVFKATLPDGRLVAVKLLAEAKGNGEEFINEVASISRTSHVNVVALLGFCSEKSKRALIYDFMPNGSLEKFIYSDQAQRQFSCEKLHEIALGIARGLEYLHGGCNTRIVHFDIKPHNILLDQDFCPKISDFGLAKLCPPKESIISMAAARGTIGYIAPEVYSRSFGVVSTKSDVYSYGMMLLEMVGGRRNIDAENDRSSEVYFPHWLYDNVDRYCKEGISGITSEMEETMRKMIVIGLWCIQMMPDNRPSMRNVVEMLKGSVEDLQMPPRP